MAGFGEAEREVESVLIKTVSKASKQHSCEKEREKEVESYHTWTCTSENYFFLLWFPKPAAPFSFSSINPIPSFVHAPLANSHFPVN